MTPLLTLLLLAPQQPDAALAHRWAEIARDARGRVGAAALVIETGQRAELKGTERFPMQSVYKLPIAMAALRRVDAGRLLLEQPVRVGRGELVPQPLHSPLREAHPSGGVDVTVRELLRLAIVESDGTASDVLMRLVGGAAAVDAYVRGLGVSGMTIATTEKAMASGQRVQYRNSATPRGAIALLVALHHGKGLSKGSRALLLKLMADAVTGPRRIRGLLPPGSPVAHKTGTSGTVHGFIAATNDIGLVALPDGHRLALAVFVSDATADTATRDGVIAHIARAAWDRWAR